jgi:hypothetical protein
MNNISALGRCPQCGAWVADLGHWAGVWDGFFDGRVTHGGSAWETRCFGCGAVLRAFHDEQKGPLGEEVTVADLRWELVADKPDREWFVSSHGGLTHERCQWKDCQQRRIKGLAFCYDHMFFRPSG